MVPPGIAKDRIGSDDAVRGRGVEDVRSGHGELEGDGLADLRADVGFHAGHAGRIDAGVEASVDGLCVATIK